MDFHVLNSASEVQIIRTRSIMNLDNYLLDVNYNNAKYDSKTTYQ